MGQLLVIRIFLVASITRSHNNVSMIGLVISYSFHCTISKFLLDFAAGISLVAGEGTTAAATEAAGKS